MTIESINGRNTMVTLNHKLFGRQTLRLNEGTWHIIKTDKEIGFLHPNGQRIVCDCPYQIETAGDKLTFKDKKDFSITFR